MKRGRCGLYIKEGRNRASCNLPCTTQSQGRQQEGLHRADVDLLELPEQFQGLKHHWLPRDKHMRLKVSATKTAQGGEN